MVSMPGAEGGEWAMKLRPWIGSLFASAAMLSAPAHAPDAGALYQTFCATCHGAGGASQAPNRDAMSRMSPGQILEALKNGSMKAISAERSRAQRRVLAEYLSGRRLTNEPAVVPVSAFCAGSG